MSSSRSIFWKMAWNEARAIVNFTEELPLAAVPRRQCPECGGELVVICGRHSNLFWWSHVDAWECRFMASQHALKFATSEAAREAETIFSKQ